MRAPHPAPLCDHCGASIDTSVQPRVIISDANLAEQLEFCGYDHLSLWAAGRHGEHELIRSNHLDVTASQLNATLARAWVLENRVVGDPDLEPEPGEYATVDSVPLHPLVELHRRDDGSPYVVVARVTA